MQDPRLPIKRTLLSLLFSADLTTGQTRQLTRLGKRVYDPVPFQNGRKWLFLTWDDYPEPATILTGLSGCIVGAIGFSKGSPYSLIGIIGNVLMSISFFLYLFLVFFVNAVLHGL